MPSTYDDLLPLLGGRDRNVVAVFRSGSRLYGCHDENSDEDFVAIIDGTKTNDLVFRPRINVIIQSQQHFKKALEEHSMLALECLFSPASHRLKPGPVFPFTLDRRALAAKALATSASDYRKAERRWPEEVLASKRKLYHSVRVLMFADQIGRQGRITDYGIANHIWFAIRDNPSENWSDYAAYSALRQQYGTSVEALPTRRR